ncbi:MAG: glycosyltransferase family 2 protein [Chthoniobacterales bacterium]
MSEIDGGTERLRLSIIVPFYNEDSNAATLIREIRAVTATWSDRYEAILIDDGSTDHTAAAIRNELVPWSEARLLQLFKNSGQAAALYLGMQAARGDYVILLDGDGQNDPQDIPRLLKALDRSDFVVGARADRQDSAARLIMSRIGNAVRSRLLGDGIKDSGCGLKAFRREVVNAFIPIRTLYSFMPALAISAGYKVTQLPVRHRPRKSGKSKYGVMVFAWRPIVDLLGVWWFCRRRCPNPLAKTAKSTGKVAEPLDA